MANSSDRTACLGWTQFDGYSAGIFGVFSSAPGADQSRYGKKSGTHPCVDRHAPDRNSGWPLDVQALSSRSSAMARRGGAIGDRWRGPRSGVLPIFFRTGAWRCYRRPAHWRL